VDKGLKPKGIVRSLRAISVNLAPAVSHASVLDCETFRSTAQRLFGEPRRGLPPQGTPSFAHFASPYNNAHDVPNGIVVSHVTGRHLAG
jgi:hypothetical protein